MMEMSYYTKYKMDCKDEDDNYFSISILLSNDYREAFEQALRYAYFNNCKLLNLNKLQDISKEELTHLLLPHSDLSVEEKLMRKRFATMFF
jgi:hypothetical protein